MYKYFIIITVILSGCAGGGQYYYPPQPIQMPSAQYQGQMQRPAATVDCTTRGNQTTCKERPKYNILQGGCNPDFPASCVNTY